MGLTNTPSDLLPGVFFVYNQRRDFSSFTPLETLGRSFVVKYTRLLDF